MRRVKGAKTKRGITLVELVVAMALTAMFAIACVMLIVPVSNIYTHTLEQNRVQLVADTVVDSLRSECSKAIVTGTGDVWIAKINNYDGSIMTAANPNAGGGNVLVFRRSRTYCETISADYEIGNALITAISTKDQADAKYKSVTEEGKGITSRSIYNLDSSDKESGLIHFGYYESKNSEISLNGSSYSYVYPGEYYDFTNPFSRSAYLGCKVELYFHDLKFDSKTNKPTYVVCDVTVADDKGATYSRSTALCFG